MPNLRKIRQHNRLSNELEELLSSMSIDQLVTLKLELITESLGGEKLYGFRLWQFVANMVQDAVLRYAKSLQCPLEALGLTQEEFEQLCVKK